MKVYTLHECNNLIARTFQNDYIFTNITVRGTVSNLHVHFSGMIFFSLIDESGRISCKIPKRRSTFLGRNIENGTEISLFGNIKYDKTQGQSFLQVERVIAVRESEISKEQKNLELELEKKGYFDGRNKKVLPKFPFHIGIITSGSGAVIYDILKTGMRRNNSVHYSLCNTTVQGEDAAESMAKAILNMNKKDIRPDVLIVARGGGSEEDFSPFNQKILLDAAFTSDIPIVSAIGHESDDTLFDRVADVRASTPTQAAEIIIPDKTYIKKHINYEMERMKYKMRMWQNACESKFNYQLRLFQEISNKNWGIKEKSHIREVYGIIECQMKQSINDKKIELLEQIIKMAHYL